jgi:enoyl-CoA hydratase
MTGQSELIAERKGMVGTLALNRPEKRNALSADLLLELHARLKEWEGAEAVRAVVITSSDDRAFSSGFDILSIPTEVTPETQELLKRHNPLELALTTVKNFPYPTIAMLNGHAFGAGLNLAINCDIRIGAEDIRVGMPPARLGVLYHPEGLRQFVEVLGMARTREVFFSGRTYAGAQVKEMGLVDHLVSRASLRAVTYALAEEIAANAPLSLKGTKRILNLLGQGAGLPEKELGEAESLIAQAFNSDDLKEGQAAFLEKRKPRFSGK